MCLRDWRSRMQRVLVSLCLACPLVCAAAWPEGSYTYYAERKPVSAVLADFCANFGLTLSASARVGGVVNGRIQVATVPEFLDRLAEMHGLVWFRHQGVLYVSRNDEQSSQQFSVAPGSIAAIKLALKESGMLNERFGWAELPAQGVVVVSGPTAYVQLVATALGRLQPAATDWRIAFMRLKYARVDDRIVQERDREIVIPGVATLLRNLVSGMRAAIAPARGASGLGLQSPGLAQPTEPAQPAPARAMSVPTPAAGGVIEADVRLNAIVVRDVPSMLPIYEQIVRQLDVPIALVQIEAMIVDVSKDRLQELGVDWTVNAGRSTVSFGDSSVAPTAGTLSLGVGATSMVGQVHSLLARIRALEQHGDAQVLSKPMLLTTDNATALIDLSETFYTRVAGERTANLVPVTAGVMLKVTPHIVPTDEGADVQLSVDIEDGALQSRDGVELPVVKRSTISTQAVIKGRSSLLIGGFNSQRNERVQQRVPLLGSLPWIGGAFRVSTVTDNNRERLFLITPTVISIAGTGPASPASATAPLPHALASNALLPFPPVVTPAPPARDVPPMDPASYSTPRDGALSD